MTLLRFLPKTRKNNVPSLKNPITTLRPHKRALLAPLRRLARHLRLFPPHPQLQVGLHRPPLVTSLARVPLHRSLLPAHLLSLPRHLLLRPIRTEGSIWLFRLFHPSRARSRIRRHNHPTVQPKPRRNLPAQAQVHNLLRTPSLRRQMELRTSLTSTQRRLGPIQRLWRLLL